MSGALSELEVFVRVVQAGSFSAAARELGLTPSAVSKQIARLEDRLGARLLNRTTRRVSVTEVGSAFHERGQRILADMAEAEQAVLDLHGAPRGTLRVSLPLAFGRLHVVPLIPGFLAAYPEVRVDLAFNDRFVDLIEEGIDVAVRVGELADSSLIVRRLAANRRVVCATEDYLARHGTPRTPADLTRHNCLTYAYRQMRNDWRFCGTDGKAQTVRVSGNLESNEVEALRSALLAGVGIALVPLWMAGPDLASGRVVEVLRDYHVPDSAIHAVYPPGRHLSPKVRAFVDLLAARFSDRECWTAPPAV
ncbi:MAG: LysR family transcriptional regulator [Kiloniellales bacterium]